MSVVLAVAVVSSAVFGWLDGQDRQHVRVADAPSPVVAPPAGSPVPVRAGNKPAVPVPPVMCDVGMSTVDSGGDLYRGMGSDVERWRCLVEQYFDSSQVETMMCLMLHESGGNPNARNPRSTARGLFQILGSLWAPHFGVAQDDLYDPVLNVRLAREIYDRQGYDAWSPYKRGLCR